MEHKPPPHNMIAALPHLESEFGGGSIEEQSASYSEGCRLDASLPAVQAILKAAYAPGDVIERGGLAEDCELLLQKITERADDNMAQAYLAHVLQELRIASQHPIDGINTTLQPLLQACDDKRQTPWEVPVRFIHNPGTHQLDMIYVEPTLFSVEDLPLLTDETLFHGKKVLFIGMGGGSDIVQAAALSEYLERNFGSFTAAFASVRKAENELIGATLVRGTGKTSTTLKRISEHTGPKGDWRFLENLMLTTPHDPLAKVPMYIINSLKRQHIVHDLNLLLDIYRPDVVMGVDTGGDSLFPTWTHETSSNADLTNNSPDQDRQVLTALSQVARPTAIRRAGVDFLTAIVAPGVDTPPAAHHILWAAEAARLPFSERDKQLFCTRYAGWSMDGSGNSQNRYGKTALAWLAALRQQYGLTMLNLPPANVVASHNTWRAALRVTPAMGEVVVTRLAKHAQAIGL